MGTTEEGLELVWSLIADGRTYLLGLFGADGAEVGGKGYGRKKITAWTELSASDTRKLMQAPAVTFVARGVWPAVHGWFVVGVSEEGGQPVIWWETYDGPVTLRAGDRLEVTPQWEIVGG